MAGKGGGGAGAATVPGSDLPAAVRPLFKDVHRCLDDRNYKKAIKTADTILKASGPHADVLALKALACLNMGRKDEAMDLVKQALKLNLRSTTCWHVHGTVHRQNGNTAEAVKCFRQALRWDAENAVVLRDLAAAQIALRDYAGHHETRRVILTSRSNVQENWLAYAASQAMAGNCALAFAILNQLESTLDPDRMPTHYTSEIVLFKARVMEQSGSPSKALQYLQNPANAKWVVDTLALREKAMQLYLRLGRYDDAVKEAVALLRINPEHYGYHRGLQVGLLRLGGGWAGDAAPGATSGTIPSTADIVASSSTATCRLPTNDAATLASLTRAQLDTLFAAYVKMVSIFPGSRAARRIPLDFLPHDHAAFTPWLAAYLRSSLRKGVPSLFTDLKTLFRSHQDTGLGWHARAAVRKAQGRVPHPTPKAAVITAAIDDILAALTRGAAMPVPALDATAVTAALATAVTPWSADPVTVADLSGAVVARGDDAVGAAPSTDDISALPWSRLFVARAADECGDTEGALRHLDEAVAHTPTILDLYVARARVLKHAGSLDAAARALDYGRSLDLADRYLNTKTTKYLLRANHTEAADKAIALFTRADAKDNPDPLATLKGLQVIWFELETAAAYERVGNVGLALRHYHRVDKHYKDYLEDHHDFHYWVTKKGTLRAYLDILAAEDHIRGHAGFLQAAAGMVRCNLALAADPSAKAGHARWQQDDVVTAATAWRAAAAKFGTDGSEATYVDRFTLRKYDNGLVQVAAAKKVADAVAAFKKSKSASSADEDGVVAEKDADGMGDVHAGVADPLAEAASAARLLLTNLPVHRHALSDALAYNDNPAFQPTPLLGGTTRAATSSANHVLRGWNITPDFVVSAYALAAEVAVRQGKPLLAAAHLKSAQKAAAASKVPDIITAIAADGKVVAALPRHHLHPIALGAALRVYAAIDAAIEHGGADAAQGMAFVQGSDQRGPAPVDTVSWVSGTALPLAATSVEAWTSIVHFLSVLAGMPSVAAAVMPAVTVAPPATWAATTASTTAAAALAQAVAIKPACMLTTSAALDVALCCLVAAVRAGLVSPTQVPAVRDNLAAVVSASDVATATPHYISFDLLVPLAPAKPATGGAGTTTPAGGAGDAKPGTE